MSCVKDEQYLRIEIYVLKKQESPLYSGSDNQPLLSQRKI